MKDIYMEINKMNKKSFEMREIASDEKVGFEKRDSYIYRRTLE